MKVSELTDSQLNEIMEIIEAVAHVGIDFGYGVFELNKEHISKARELYEEISDDQNNRPD